MADNKKLRLNKVLRELNISLDRAVEHLANNGFEIEARPTTKISNEEYQLLIDGFQTDRSKKAASKEVGEEKRKEKEALRIAHEKELERKRLEEEARKVVFKTESEKLKGLKTIGKIELDSQKSVKESTKKAEDEEKTKPKVVETPEVKKEIKPQKHVKKVEVKKEKNIVPEKKSEATIKQKIKKSISKKDEVVLAKKEPEKIDQPKLEENSNKIKTVYQKLGGPKLTGQKIDLKQFERPKKKKETPAAKTRKPNDTAHKKKRKRINKPAVVRPSRFGQGQGASRGKGPHASRGGFKGKGRKPIIKVEPTEAEVQKQIRETLEKLQGKSSRSKGAKHRRDKRELHRQKTDKEILQKEAESRVIKVNEFATVSELATLMNVSVTEIISACMSLGLMVTMNQRLDAETITIVADEFDFKVDFIGAEVEESFVDEEDLEEDLVTRAPIITVMGHVDHGKTSLLDYIRKSNVIAGESGGITQHIGAYSVQLTNNQKITFLDTPGHEAFTAMRARGAQVTDLAVIVIAADDSIMPQTREAISHAQAAGIPMVFAINKIDKPGANPEKVKEELAGMNLLVEDWGGKIQSQDISAKTGVGIDDLLEKVLLEAELLELKANPNKSAIGTVVEALLDKGKGYVSTVLIEAGTLKIGDYVLAGKNSGKVKSMLDERGNVLKEAGPSMPVSILGLDGAPQAGDKFKVFEDEREAKHLAAKRSQLRREQAVRTQKHITLDEIGRRIALGDFKELNIVLKGDVDGSVEALTDSLQKLSTQEIQVNIIHKAVGAITESDVLLASASEAIIVGFNVRPTGNARSLADKEEIDVRSYSIIYDVINDVRDAMEGMLSPEIKEEITGNVEIREIFKISKVGTIAGCMVISGKIFRNSKIRLLRDHVVTYTGELASLKRFKDDVKEVSKGYDCGLSVKNYNDIRVDDVIEAYKEVAVKKKL